MRETFSLTEAESTTPEEVRKSLKVKISEMHYPLWILEFDPELVGYGSGTFCSLISSLQAFIFSDEVPNDDQLKVITELLGGMTGQYLAKNFTKDRMSRCFAQFLTMEDENIASHMQKLNLDPNGVRDVLGYLLKEDASRWNQEEVMNRLPLLKTALLSVEALSAVCVSRINDLAEMDSTFESRFPNRLSFEVYQIACDSEGAKELSKAFGVLQEVLRLPERLNKGDALKITESDIELVIQNASDLSTYLDNPCMVIKVLASTWEHQELDEWGEKEVFEKMLKMIDKTTLKDLGEEKVRELIGKAVGDLARNRLIREIQEKWRSLTGTLTVENWEERHKMPIQWVLDDDTLKGCIKDIRALHNLPESKLVDILDILKDRAADLSKLSDESYLLPKFVATIMPAYAEVLDDLNSMSQLRDHIYGRMEKKKPVEWSDSVSTIQKFAREWLQRRYREAVARNVQQMLMQMHGEELKSLIANEVENNTELGLALYECLRRREGG